MKPLNLKEVAELIVKKYPHQIMMERKTFPEDKTTETIATEKSKDYENYRHNAIGEKFEKFPFLKNDFTKGTWKQNLKFIGVDGEVIDTCDCLEYIKFTNGEAVSENKKNWKIKGDDNAMVVAVLSSIHSETYKEGSNTNSAILFLSKPYTVKEINDLRSSYYLPIENERIETALKKIETIWA